MQCIHDFENILIDNNLTRQYHSKTCTQGFKYFYELQARKVVGKDFDFETLIWCLKEKATQNPSISLKVSLPETYNHKDFSKKIHEILMCWKNYENYSKINPYKTKEETFDVRKILVECCENIIKEKNEDTFQEGDEYVYFLDDIWSLCIDNPIALRKRTTRILSSVQDDVTEEELVDMISCDLVERKHLLILFSYPIHMNHYVYSHFLEYARSKFSK